MPERTWTTSQRRAIETVDRSVLVSAGAGSGKTAVLAERCAELVANPRTGCSVNQLLVVTFTDAASAEMRSRIAAALRARLAQSPASAWLQRQLALLDGAAISTLHSFCRQILGKYFAHAGMDPLMPMLDPADARLLRKESARQIFDQFGRREDPAGEAFLDLVASYSPSGESQLIDRVLEVDAFLNSILDPDAWMRQSLDSLATDRGELSDDWRSRLVEIVRHELDEQSRLVEQQLASLRGAPDIVAESRTSLASYAATLEGWRTALQGSPDSCTLDAVCREGIGQYKFPPIPRITPKIKALPEPQLAAFTRAAEMLRAIRDKLFAKRLHDAFGQFTVAEWAEGLARTRPHAEGFISLVTALRTAFQQAKAALGVMDFTDLERRARELLLNDANHVAAQLRDRFAHVLVDEFQDINPVQADILRLVSRESEAGRPANLFTVGDVKQSIYRFRLAEPMLFLKRRERFSEPVAAASPLTSSKTSAAAHRAGRDQRRHGALDGRRPGGSTTTIPRDCAPARAKITVRPTLRRPSNSTCSTTIRHPAKKPMRRTLTKRPIPAAPTGSASSARPTSSPNESGPSSPAARPTATSSSSSVR
jgi:ATP-dependent helicase/nuclease subunit A